MLRRHERDLPCAVFRERVLRVYESRLDDFVPAVWGRQAVLRHDARGEATVGSGSGVA
jgi:hypothetical protein